MWPILSCSNHHQHTQIEPCSHATILLGCYNVNWINNNIILDTACNRRCHHLDTMWRVAKGVGRDQKMMAIGTLSVLCLELGECQRKQRSRRTSTVGTACSIQWHSLIFICNNPSGLLQCKLDKQYHYHRYRLQPQMPLPGHNVKCGQYIVLASRKLWHGLWTYCSSSHHDSYWLLLLQIAMSI